MRNQESRYVDFVVVSFSCGVNQKWCSVHEGFLKLPLKKTVNCLTKHINQSIKIVILKSLRELSDMVVQVSFTFYIDALW